MWHLRRLILAEQVGLVEVVDRLSVFFRSIKNRQRCRPAGDSVCNVVEMVDAEILFKAHLTKSGWFPLATTFESPSTSVSDREPSSCPSQFSSCLRYSRVCR